MLINFSNHLSTKWSEKQLAAALMTYGSVLDLPFPEIDASASENEICALALDKVSEIAALAPDAVLCQGEFSFTFAVAAELMRRGVPVICATSERRAFEVKAPDGSTHKQIVFRFEKFREYRTISPLERGE